MSYKTKTQIKVSDDIFLIDGRPYADGRIVKTMKPLGAAFTTATLPDPAALADGLLAYNVDIKALMVTEAGAWVKA